MEEKRKREGIFRILEHPLIAGLILLAVGTFFVPMIKDRWENEQVSKKSSNEQFRDSQIQKESQTSASPLTQYAPQEQVSTSTFQTNKKEKLSPKSSPSIPPLSPNQKLKVAKAQLEEKQHVESRSHKKLEVAKAMPSPPENSLTHSPEVTKNMKISKSGETVTSICTNKDPLIDCLWREVRKPYVQEF